LGGRLCVLIVEDLPEQAEIVAHELARAGFALAWSIASDLPGCRSALERGVDLVVADCDTAAVDFAALMALVGEQGDPPPVVGLSTDHDEGIASECLRGGASAFLHKLRLDQIGDLVRGLMEDRPRTATVCSDPVDFRSFAENASDLVAELSSDGRVFYLSPSAEAELGYVAEELSGRGVFEFLHPDDLAGALELLRKAGVAGSASRGVHRVRRRDGSWVWLESTANPCLTTEGERRVVVIAREIVGSRSDHPPEPDHQVGFSVTNPHWWEAAVDPREEAAEAGPEDAGSCLPTVLVVAGEDLMRSVICQTLEEDGYAVIQAAGTEEALERAANHSGPIQLVVCDLETPGIDGRALAEGLGSSRPRTRLMAMSDSAGNSAELALKQGSPAVGILRKPFTLAALRAKLHQVLEEEPDPFESG
jgi:PAS domain S-box-containing protein